MIAEWQRDGCRHWPEIVPAPVLEALRSLADDSIGAGERLSGTNVLLTTALPWLLPVAENVLGDPRAVRATLFDKGVHANWSVPWHQDRTIAVAKRRDVDGFGPWSMKAGVLHVEPPFAILADMVTLRLHFDDCPVDNAPLVVAAGSHGLYTAAADAADRASMLPQIVCTAAAGDVWAYATPILHRSDRANIPLRRRVLQVDFAAGPLPAGLEWAL